jgi:hypothetical protein
MKGTVRFRFDYGVFLLNKNIERLAESQGLKVMDIRQTLPNLKYVLYVCSAGNTDLPARKAGGVRGLITGREIEIGSRRGSADSGIVGAQSEAIRKALENGSAEARGGKLDAGKGYDDSNLVKLPFRDANVQSLRTRGLRENIKR